MAIEISQRQSPGWWMKRLFDQLHHRDRQNRLKGLEDRYDGNGPLPQGADNVRELFAAFQKKARTNFAELIVGAVSERMTPVGFRTSADDDETGDAEAAAAWKRAGMKVLAADVHDKMLNLGEAYVIVGPVDEETGAPIITAESPRNLIGDPDPVQPNRLRAALKVMFDDVDQQERAYLYLPGQIAVAFRDTTTASGIGATLSPSQWSWDKERSGTVAHGRMPVVQVRNKDGRGEYERHVDLIDRISHQILQRLVIATMQAFRQRAVRGLPDEDEEGNELDWSEVFVMDPAALWQLPREAEMWESATVDLAGILNASKDDIQQLGAVTRTPLFMLLPAGANQSAEGASLQREGLVFKARDRIDRVSGSWAKVMSLAFLQLGQAQRADLSKLETLWAPAERLSLTERADAASKAANDIPRRSRLIHIWGFDPRDADRMMSEFADDKLLEAQIAAATAAGKSATVPTLPATPARDATASLPSLAGLDADPLIDQGQAPA